MPGTRLVYAGKVGGSHHREEGGAANHLCMPPDPDTLDVESGQRGIGANLYGFQYQSPLVGEEDGNIPCAVCLVTERTTVIMIPAKIVCPSGWTLEYFGYLMTERTHSVHRRSTYECVDSSQESLGTNNVNEGGLLTHVEARCGKLECPPYNADHELTCAVCTI